MGPPDYSLECRRASSRHCAVLGLLFAVVISLLYGSFAPKLRLSQQTCVFTVGVTACEILLQGLTGLDGESVKRKMLRLCSTIVISSIQSDTRCWYILNTYQKCTAHDHLLVQPLYTR